MARLAAYYQEDFHYPSLAYAPKQRKSAYLFFEEPKNNVFGSHQFNGNRIRSLATSEPSLVGELSYSPQINNMTLKQRPFFYGSQLIENPQTSHPYFENEYHVTRGRGIEPETFDNESMYSFCDMPYDDRYDQRYRPRSKDKSRKRYSYAEPRNNSLHSPDVYIPQNIQRHHHHRPMQEENMYNYSNGHQRVMHPDNYHTNPTEHSLSPPVFYHNDPRQQWPWVGTNAYVNPSLLSPPSPLDSGLSSQSIASSPSLETEPLHAESYPLARSHRHRSCLCPRVEHFENGRCVSRYDSGRSSPGVYAMAYPANAVLRTDSRMSNHIQDVDYPVEGFENHSQVRYGKLGIVGEPTDLVQSIAGNSPKKRYDNFHQQEMKKNGRVSYIYTDKNGVPLRKGMRKSHKSESKYTKPCVIIIESPEKGAGSERTSSPEQDNSEKSPGSDSPMSVTVSNSSSNSPSVASSNDLDHDERRKIDRTTENEIRELEDMYEKCNLGDSDLLDRAERRDLPTAHQRKSDKGSHRLTRSNSDTLFEMMSPVFHNPYETPQRAPPLRRAGLPDRIADDMALRKYRKSASRSNFNQAKNAISYMLCSSHFTPTVPVNKDILLLDNPDVELDDLSYRKHYFGKKSKIMDPQPPFGIPLRPPPPQRVYNDYLHAVPSSAPQPLCHPRGNPDVVRDDMAFRTLRKEEPERIYYDISQMYKKKR